MLHIGNTPYTGNYALDGIQLELLDNYRDLGIQIDSKLKFHIHTDTVVKKAYRVLGLIRKSFECKDYDVIVKLYKSLVRPIIEYNNVLWGPFYVSDNQKIERIQRKATRIIPSISHLSYHDRLRHLNLPSLQHRRRRGDLICLYQILKGAYDIDNQLFIPSTHIKNMQCIEETNTNLQINGYLPHTTDFIFINCMATSTNRLHLLSTFIFTQYPSLWGI